MYNEYDTFGVIFIYSNISSRQKISIMAIAIREIPVLTGQSAIDFVNETDKYSDRPVPHLSMKREMELRSIKEAHKHFVW